MQPRDSTPDELSALQNNRCPDCGNYGFHDGPRGGLAQHIFCCSPYCRAGFNVGPVPRVIMAQRIGRGPLAYYPPQTHAIIDTPNGTLPVCAFVMRAPADWPRGHLPADREVTCPDCLQGLRNAVRSPMASAIDATVRDMLRRMTK
jgi:hypothetical protein